MDTLGETKVQLVCGNDGAFANEEECKLETEFKIAENCVDYRIDLVT